MTLSPLLNIADYLVFSNWVNTLILWFFRMQMILIKFCGFSGFLMQKDCINFDKE